jgi:hypothetical protein
MRGSVRWREGEEGDLPVLIVRKKRVLLKFRFII